ncbi:MAG TPA: ATP-binding protein [Gammaproteobacteria bacterium]|nr:ATP-binding protein [Gammaproteobacteria bacterium]
MEPIHDPDKDHPSSENSDIISALREENDTLHRIIELLPGNVYWKDTEGKFLGCNKNMAYVAGVESPDDITGKTTVQLFGEKLGNPVNQIDNQVMREGKEHTIEEQGVTSNNQPAIYLSKKLPVYNKQGKILGTMGVSFDITDRKRMEKELKIAKEIAEASERAKSRFVATVNHELRTPLASILGLVDLLKEGDLNDRDLEKTTTSIEKSTQYLLNLVNDVLDFSKLETGKYTLQLGPVNFSHLLRDLRDMFRPLIRNRDIVLRLETDKNLPNFLLGDEHILRHVLLNFVSNAVKYTKKGRVTIKTQMLQQTEKYVRLKISIKDTGIGIPEDKLDEIFQPFQQLNDTWASRNGTGLGLTIVKKLIETMGATMEVESKPGKGSTFSFTMDYPFPDENYPIIEKKPLPNVNREMTRQPIVLVIEDDPIIQFIHRKLLINIGCVVDMVDNAADALRILNETHEMIFLDLSLPDIRGPALIKKIRETTPYTCPIVIISAFIDKEEEIACMKAGAIESITKPVSQAKLRELILQHCYPPDES